MQAIDQALDLRRVLADDDRRQRSSTT